MAAAATHLLVGILVAAVAGVPTRYLPVAGLLAEWIDLDHIFSGPGPNIQRAAGEPLWMMNRATLHNVWIVAVVPALVAAWLYWRRRGPEDLRRLAVAAPAIMSSHTLFDMVELHTGHPYNGSFPFYPFSLERLGFDVNPIVAYPAYFDALSFAVLVAILLGLGARILVAGIDGGDGSDRGGQDGPAPGADDGSDPGAGELPRGRDDVEAIARAGLYLFVFVLLVPLLTWITAVPIVEFAAR